MELVDEFVCTLYHQEALHHADISPGDDHSALNVPLSSSTTVLTKVHIQPH